MTEMADWTRAYVLMGKYNGTYIPVLLGPLGQMYGVLQGDEDGTLTTVKLTEGKLWSVLQGDEDGTLTTVKLTEGKLWSVLQGDEDGTLTTVKLTEGKLWAVLQGNDDGTLTTVELEEGKIIAVLQGNDDGTLTTVELEEGKIIAVLQGDDGGVLRTIGLDGEGRISAYVVDDTDEWGRVLAVGNAELAARLGSAVHYDRRGQVAFVDSFENGWGIWAKASDGAGAATALDPTSALTGGYAAKLTGGSDSARFASIAIKRGLVPTGRMGLEFAFALGSVVEYVHGYLSISDGSRNYRAQVRYDHANGRLYIYNDAGGWTWILSAEAAGTVGKPYNVLKFVVDLSAKKYERLLFNDEEVDLSAYGYYDAAASSAYVVAVQITCYSRSGQNDVIYVDDIIVTLAEPEN